jgi:hypothetical protein
MIDSFDLLPVSYRYRTDLLPISFITDLSLTDLFRAFLLDVKFFVLTSSPGSQLFHGINRSLTQILIP